MIQLENENIKASLKSKGAELCSLVNKQTNIDYIWRGDASFWPRHSPVLFPIVGGLIGDSFVFKGKRYQLEKHGFARDMDFEFEYVLPDQVSFVLKNSEKTFKSYPFSFLLRISYTLVENKIVVSYEVENPGEETMYFSIGTHPAFNIPLTKGTVYEDYYLEFSEIENSARQNLNGNILRGQTPYFQSQKKLPLKHELFYQDAIIFKDLKSDSISIKSDKTPHGLRFNFEGFPYMGIWAAEDAPFVCIEPWCGLPDTDGHNQNIQDKEGIISLEPKGRWQKKWSLECF